MATSGCCWRVYWPEDASPCQPDAPQALFGWRVGPRCLVVAALVPLQGAAERLAARWRGGGKDESKVARPCILGEYGAPASSSSSTGKSGVDGSVWLVMEPGPRVRALHVYCASRNVEELESEASPTTIAIVRYRRSHHGTAGVQPRGSTELDCALWRMAQAGSVQRALDGAEAAVLVSPPAAAEPSAPPSPSLMTRSSLACAQLSARGTLAWRALRYHNKHSTEATTGLLVDSALGVALGLLLWQHRGTLHAAWAHWHWKMLHPDALARGAAWLASYPGGFKLNLPLTQRLGAVVVLVAELYTAALQQAAGAIPADWVQMPSSLPLCIGAGALIGATTVLAGGFDLVRALTGHVPFIHASITRLYHLELCTLASLGRLFWGRKRNALRRRIDSCEYSTQQLLLGTLLFTIGVALFPTLAAFHAACTALHLAVRALQAGLWLLLVLLRDLPLHGLALRLCTPERFVDPLRVAHCRPCGLQGDDAVATIHFVASVKQDGVTGVGSVIADTEEGGDDAARGGKPAAPAAKIQAQQTVLRLEYGSVPWARLFDGYARTARALRKASPSPGRALGALLTGSLLTEVEADGEEEGRPPRLAFFQYRSLPQILVEAALASSP